jgi:hypothetical protein
VSCQRCKSFFDDFSNSQAKLAADDGVRNAESDEQRHISQSLEYLQELYNHPARVLKTDDDVHAAPENINHAPIRTSFYSTR